ncbi:M23 family metallopeptidase [Tsuneonella sp. HG094]
MALKALDRLLTIVVTATLTSAVWIVAGGTLMQRATVLSQPGGPLSMPSATPSAAVLQEASMVQASVVSQVPGKLVIPVTGVTAGQLVDTFTQARAGGTRVHDAIDIMAPEGTPVVSAAPGKLEKLFLSKDGGKTTYVRSTDGRTIYYYAHLRDYAPGLAENQSVTAGQRLGSVGYTGNASPDAPHLHFAILQTSPQSKWYQPSIAINPYPLLRR